MIKKWMTVLVLIIPVFVMQLAQAGPNPHQVVVNVNNHVLKEYQIKQLLQLADFLSASRIKPEHRSLLRRWAVEDFRNAPESTSIFYQEIARDFLPRIQQLKPNRKALETYRASLYQKIYQVFQSDPAMKRWNYDLMDVVGWYKPPQGKTRHASRIKKPQQQPRRVVRQQPTQSPSQAVLNATAEQMRQSLAAMVALQQSQALYRQRSAALAFQNAMSQRSTDMVRIQACQIAGNCRYRYDYLDR